MLRYMYITCVAQHAVQIIKPENLSSCAVYEFIKVGWGEGHGFALDEP
jgi:hypothetical protein